MEVRVPCSAGASTAASAPTPAGAAVTARSLNGPSPAQSLLNPLPTSRTRDTGALSASGGVLGAAASRETRSGPTWFVVSK
jgi:hypothetical protein